MRISNTYTHLLQIIQNLNVDFECWYIRTHTKSSNISNITVAIFPSYQEKNTQTECHPEYFGIYYSWWLDETIRCASKWLILTYLRQTYSSVLKTHCPLSCHFKISSNFSSKGRNLKKQKQNKNKTTKQNKKQKQTKTKSVL